MTSLSSRRRAELTLLNSTDPLPRLRKHTIKSTDHFGPASSAPGHNDISIFQRLSGYDADSTLCSTTPKPANKSLSSLCVRCSEPACICMQCTERISEQSLKFYKETRAKGAMELFTNAITHAGAAKILKFVIFKMWRNGFVIRSRLKNRKNFIAERRFRRTITIKPFLAWKTFISMKFIERKDKKIESLEKHVRDLEIHVAALMKQKRAAEAREEHLHAEITRRDEAFAKQREIIMKIYEEVGKERSRLISVCALTEPIHSLTTIMEEAASNTAQSLNTAITDLAKRPLHDYLKFFDNEARELIKLHRKKSVTQEYFLSHNSHSETIDEIRLSERLMFDWINNTSRDAGLRTDPVTGRSLAKYLPTYERTTSFPQLKDGKQLSRVIMSLVHDVCDFHEMQGHGINRLTTDQWDDIQSAHTRPIALIRLILKHALFYLHLPLYRFDDVLEGRSDTMQTLVSNLMILSYPTMHPESKKMLERERKECDAIHKALKQLQHVIGTQHQLQRVHSLWKSVQDESRGFDNITLGGRNGNSNGNAGMGMAMGVKSFKGYRRGSRGSLAGDAALLASDLISTMHGRGNGPGHGDSSDEDDDDDEKRTFEFFERLGEAAKTCHGLPLDDEIIDRFPIFTLGSSYDQLSVAIDDFIRQGADRKLVDTVSQISQNFRSLSELRHNVDHFVQDTDEGMVLAAEIRQKIGSHSTVALLRRLRLVTDDIEE
eukprot:gene8917-18450_t